MYLRVRIQMKRNSKTNTNVAITDNEAHVDKYFTMSYRNQFILFTFCIDSTQMCVVLINHRNVCDVN